MADDALRAGLRYALLDPRLRYQPTLEVNPTDQQPRIEAAIGETTRLRRIGHVRLPSPIDASIDLWWLEQYGGGLFIPIRDQPAGTTSYGGGRCVVDTAKAADLGSERGRLTIDLNFLYHPSCRDD